nr:hypothetical protein [uncultured Lacibacter sp.]
MRYILCLFTAFLLVFSANSQTSICFAASLSITNPVDQEIIKPQQQKQKLTFKERLLKKILERKLKRAALDKEKRAVNTFGILSFASGIAALVSFILVGVVLSSALMNVLAILSLLLMVLALVTGIVSLSMRKKLADKKGTHLGFALTGVIIGGGLILAILIAIIYIMIYGF